ncbi:MAG TPA: hypothetical protein VNT29_04605, partial [Candidatus Limnocylindrales bacterium]|nr:hypothetical protein [Candidatus Limnocylindrales bacterium]
RRQEDGPDRDLDRERGRRAQLLDQSLTIADWVCIALLGLRLAAFLVLEIPLDSCALATAWHSLVPPHKARHSRKSAAVSTMGTWSSAAASAYAASNRLNAA